jgi:hypothetical protein
MGSRTWAALATAAVVVAALPAAAFGSQLIDRNANHIKLSVSKDGKALITYTARGGLKRTLAWGAVNSIAPTTARKQVAFKVDYSGGYESFHIKAGQFRGSCGKYDGPTLHWVVAACKAPDGSYWVAQNWQRALPNFGLRGTPSQRQYELRLSHFSGPLPVFTVGVGWAHRKFHTIWGQFTYLGKPIFGYATTHDGRPTDTFGRVAYVDTYNSAYGKGWKRENSFVTHKTYGTFCYAFSPHGSHPSGMSSRYRITIMGPGVQPDMYWEGPSPGPRYDKTFAGRQLAALRAFGDPTCG